MCLVFISFRPDRDVPVMIGANREEARRRPATSPVCCRSGSLRCLLAGADHGPNGSFPMMGTWLGVNEAGLAVAVTNRHDGELAWQDQVRSRGLLAVDLLGRDRVEEALGYACAQLSMGGFGGCDLLIADYGRAVVVHAPGAARVNVVELAPGTHAMTNLDVDQPDDQRIELVLHTLDPGDFLASAARICRDPRIIIAGRDRGTVSSSLVSIGAEIVLYHVLGDPTGRDYNEYQLHSMRHSRERTT
jgi:uncharacterized protein with NRDE domain